MVRRPAEFDDIKCYSGLLPGGPALTRKTFYLCKYRNERIKFKELVDDYVITLDKSYDK